jgi:hypothetical protein
MLIRGVTGDHPTPERHQAGVVAIPTMRKPGDRAGIYGWGDDQRHADGL